MLSWRATSESLELIWQLGDDPHRAQINPNISPRENSGYLLASKPSNEWSHFGYFLE
jgi:hypothetical protein